MTRLMHTRRRRLDLWLTAQHERVAGARLFPIRARQAGPCDAQSQAVTLLDHREAWLQAVRTQVATPAVALANTSTGVTEPVLHHAPRVLSHVPHRLRTRGPRGRNRPYERRRGGGGGRL